MITPIPDAFPFPDRSRWHFDIKDSMDQFKHKEEWNQKGMYAHVNWQWVKPLAHWIGARKVLEVMAGAGWLARALREAGTDVVATDDYSWIKERDWALQTEIIQLDAVESVERYGPSCDILLISWPYMDASAYETISAWHLGKPDAPIIYIGEGVGGCTADEQFFEHLENIQDQQFSSAASQYRSYWGLHDAIVLGKYVSNDK